MAMCDTPKEIINFFNQEDTEILTVQQNINLIATSEFELIDFFKLNKKAHIENYYLPLEQRLITFLVENNYCIEAKKIADFIQYEINLYRKYSDCYGYCFYIMKKK